MPRFAKSILSVALVVLFSLAIFASPVQAASPGAQLGQERTAWLDFDFAGWLQQVLDTIFGTAPTATAEESDGAPSRLYDKARVNLDPNGGYAAGTSPEDEGGLLVGAN